MNKALKTTALSFTIAALCCSQSACFTASTHMATRPSFTASPTMLRDVEVGTALDKEMMLDTVLSSMKPLPFSRGSVSGKNNINNINLEVDMDVSEAEQMNGMPWKESIAGADAPLIYMAFWEWQMDFMKSHLTNLKVLECSARGSTSFAESTQDLSFVENKEKKARIVNLCFQSDEYRKIRMTYYDAGEGCQVFNSVFYPHEDSNLPVLGVDILSFNRKKFLAIVDFQPLYQDEDQHDALYERQILKPIREQYKNLKGKMSSKFYDETQFFSRQMLFSRFENEDIIYNELFPAFQQYVAAHLDLVNKTPRSADNIPVVRERQIAYDTYSADRDPATGLFAAMFGKDWADQFVHGFLFSRSERSESSNHNNAQPPFMGGPPSQHQKQSSGNGNPFATSTSTKTTPS